VSQLIRDGLRGSEKKRSFGDLAFNFRTAANGREALELLRQEAFDVLICDIYLPILDGPEVIRQIRATESLRALPIIAVSAGGDSAREEALAAGANFFLPKPMRLRQVIETMQQLMAMLTGEPG
jgi:CheY-like chemotaxis protein